LSAAAAAAAGATAAVASLIHHGSASSHQRDIAVFGVSNKHVPIIRFAASLPSAVA